MAAPDLVSYVAASTGLSEPESARVIADVVAYHAEPIDAYVRRRHRELQGRGHRNPEIYAAIAADLEHRVVAAPRLSERQLRRIVYG